MGKKVKYSVPDFIQAVKESFSYSGVCRKIGLVPIGGNLRTVKLRIKRLNLDISHFTGARWNKGLTSKDHSSIKVTPIEEILTKDSGWGSHTVKLRILKLKLKEPVCECCKRTEWEGQPIPLELHHINGDHFDNRLENLQLLCKNCHYIIHHPKRN